MCRDYQLPISPVGVAATSAWPLPIQTVFVSHTMAESYPFGRRASGGSPRHCLRHTVGQRLCPPGGSSLFPPWNSMALLLPGSFCSQNPPSLFQGEPFWAMTPTTFFQSPSVCKNDKSSSNYIWSELVFRASGCVFSTVLIQPVSQNVSFFHGRF